MKNFNEDEAKALAISDIGLTEFEADEAVSDFMNNLDDGYSYCEDCNVKLTDTNCDDEFSDDYCNKCHIEFQVSLVKRMGGISSCGFDDVNGLHRQCEGNA